MFTIETDTLIKVIFFKPWSYLCAKFRKIGSMNFYNFYMVGYFRRLSSNSYLVSRIIGSLALSVVIFVFAVHYGSYWANFKTMFYRLSNLGASPFRSTSDTGHIFLSILPNFCILYTRPCPRWWHSCWWRMLEFHFCPDERRETDFWVFHPF